MTFYFPFASQPRIAKSLSSESYSFVQMLQNKDNADKTCGRGRNEKKIEYSWEPKKDNKRRSWLFWKFLEK